MSTVGAHPWCSDTPLPDDCVRHAICHRCPPACPDASILPAEIRQIDALTGNGLVHVMQLAQRKPLAYQSGDDLRIFDFATKSAEA